MSIVVVGNITKDIYLNLDTRSEFLETDRDGTEWLNLSFNASKHHFFNRNSSFGGSAVSLEVLQKMGLTATISGSNLDFSTEQPSLKTPPSTYRYILVANNQVTYFTPSQSEETAFQSPAEAIDYLFIDRSANLNPDSVKKIQAYLELSQNTKLVLYVHPNSSESLTPLLSKADLIFLENNRGQSGNPYALATSDFVSQIASLPAEKIIHLSDSQISYLNITEPITIENIDTLTHLSAYSILSATILGSFVLGFSVEESLKIARANSENAKINTALSLDELKEIANTYNSDSNLDNLELISASLMINKKGILAADESGGSIKKKFAQLDIEDTYDNRQYYRNLFFSTPGIEKYLSGIILFDETARGTTSDGQNVVEYLTGKCIIPGIKVDKGLAPLNEIYPDLSADITETYTKGLDDLRPRLEEYYQMGLRFAKWRAAFNITLTNDGELLTPTDAAITENCRILADYASICQSANIVPIVEPEIVYDGNYPIEKSAEVTSHILDVLFENLKEKQVNLKACILKTNMVLAGKKWPEQSTPEVVGQTTAEVLKNHVPADLAGVVFLSGGQTEEQATENLAEIVKNGPFPWPVTFSFARALQDPALYAWAGNSENSEKARQAFLDRLIANIEVL